MEKKLDLKTSAMITRRRFAQNGKLFNLRLKLCVRVKSAELSVTLRFNFMVDII